MKLTVKFTDDGGDALTVVFDNANGTVANDRGFKGAFTYDQASNTATINAEDFKGTVTYAGPPPLEIGAQTRYTNSFGQKGVATLLAVE